jgi:hypothetical protein
MFIATANELGLDPDEDFTEVESEVLTRLEDIIKGGHGLDEAVAETVPMNDAVKVLRHYGADHFKTTSNELHFYKNGRPLSLALIMNDDATRSVNLSQLNSATRSLKGVAEAAQSPYAIGMAAAKKKYGYGDKPAHDLPKKVIKKAHEIGDKIKADEAYSMDDVRKDASARIKKDMDSASDKRIADAKKKKDEPFMAQVGRKIIGGVTGAVKGAAKGFTEGELPHTADNEYYCNVDRVAKPIPEGYKKLASGYITRK